MKRWLVEGFSFFSLQSKVGRSELLNYFTRNGSNFNYRNLNIDEESKAIAWHNWDRQFVPDKDMTSEYSPTIKVVLLLLSFLLFVIVCSCFAMQKTDFLDRNKVILFLVSTLTAKGDRRIRTA